MSLLDEYKETFTIQEITQTDDELGGNITTTRDLDTFSGSFVYTNASEKQKAQQLDLESNYSLLVDKSVVLPYNTIIRRNKNNKLYIICSNGIDFYTPSVSTLNLRQVSLKEWEV